MDTPYRVLADAMPQIVWTSNPDGWLDFYNQRWFEYTGLTLEETQGWGWEAVLHPDDLQNCIDIWTNAYTSGEPYEVYYRFKRASDGMYRWHLGRALPMRDENGKITKWFGTCTDVHDQKEAERALSESEANFRALADAISQIVWQADASGNLIFLNRRWYEISGLPVSEALGAGWTTRIHPDDLERITTMRKLAIENGVPYEFKYRLRYHGSDEYHWMLGNGQPFFDENGVITKWHGTGTDIEHLIRQEETERALEQDRDLALESVRLRSEFLAHMSHEIRTPINGIVGVVDLLLDTDLDAEQKKFLGLVHESSETLVNLIDDILDFSKIESGQLSLERIPFNLVAVASSVVDLLQPRASAKGIEVFQRISSSIPKILIGDPHRLKQVFLNLLGNAVKFTSKGEVVVEAMVVEEKGSAKTIRIAVKDTGIGIADSAIPLLFDAFTQADSSTTRQYGGTGLGLSIAQRLVAAMGGDILVESKVGQGSTFSFTITLEAPFVEARTPQANGPHYEFFNKREVEHHSAINPQTESFDTQAVRPRILLAEDNPINTELVLHILKKINVDVDVAVNGVEVLAKTSEREYSLILMDCQMPDMDGYSTTRELRRRELQARSHELVGNQANGIEILEPHSPHVNIVALTANAMKGDKERCLEAGMDGYLSKPFRSADLLKMVAEFC